jgi:integrase/recombinase XerC
MYELENFQSNMTKNSLSVERFSYVKRFLDFLDVSPISLREYYVGLRTFFEYCDRHNIQKVEREDIINFRDEMKEEGKAANTINLYLSAVKMFYKWLDYEQISRDVARNVKSLPSEETHIRETLTVEQVKKLIDCCKNNREKLAISLLVTTGIRGNELCNIRISDFAAKNGKVCLYVMGKGRKGLKPDFVVISDSVLDQIKSYIVEYKVIDYLFYSLKDVNKIKPITVRAMRNVVNAVFERAGLKTKNVVMHSLRHTNASLAIQNGVDIREVSQNLRHKSLATTMLYLHDLDKINNNCADTLTDLIFNDKKDDNNTTVN